MRKPLILLTLAVLFCLSISAVCFAEDDEWLENDSLSWEFDANTGTLSIHGEGPMRDYASDYPEWEDLKDSIRSVRLDEGITSVGAYAFFDYEVLTEAHLPDSVEKIGCSAFDYDFELRSITIPANLKRVGSRAFYNTLLWEPADLVFPEGLESIGDEAFHSALKSGGIVSLPASLRELGAKAFTNAYLSDFVVAEGNEVFCSADHAVFSKDMKEMRMLAPVTGGLGEYRVPEGVEKISSECFNVMQGIRTVSLPASVTEIEEGAFFSTFDLQSILVDEANPNYKSENGILMSKDGKLLLAWPDGIAAGGQLVIPDGVERLGEYVFYGRNDGAYAVTLPEGLQEIGTMSLPASTSALTLPASLKSIDSNVFYGGMSLGPVSYNGSAADWEQITIGEGNAALESAVISMR